MGIVVLMLGQGQGLPKDKRMQAQRFPALPPE